VSEESHENFFKKLNFYCNSLEIRSKSSLFFHDKDSDVARSIEPEVITLTQEEVETLKTRIANSSLTEQDQKIIFSLLSFNFWLQNQLQRAKLSILRLKKIFSSSTEKKSPK
jgi:hypothetical protein